MAKSEISVEYVALSEVESWPRNPKQHDDTGIILSIVEHGFNDPPAVDENTGRLVEGHGRIEALRSMKSLGETPPDRVVVRAEDGEWMIPVLRGISFETEERAQAYLIAHNRLTEKGGWNEKELQLMLQEIMEESEAALESTGYSVEDLDALTEMVLGATAATGTGEGGGGGGSGEDSAGGSDEFEGDEQAFDNECPSCGYEWNGPSR